MFLTNMFRAKIKRFSKTSSQKSKDKRVVVVCPKSINEICVAKNLCSKLIPDQVLYSIVYPKWFPKYKINKQSTILYLHPGLSESWQRHVPLDHCLVATVECRPVNVSTDQHTPKCLPLEH